MTASIRQEHAVLVIGAGAMGGGIAQVAAAAGHKVGLFDVRPDAPAAAIGRIGEGLGRLVDRGRMTSEARADLLARLEPVADLRAFAHARLVIEAVMEDLAVKRELFARLESLLSADAILATNTSSLSVTAIAASLNHPERLAGMHFFNPAPVMALVEVVRGLATSEEVIETLVGTARAWGKSPVVTASSPGFIVNRVARPFYGEALRVLQEGGADPATLDAVLREGVGFRMGPFELMDLIGHDVSFAATSAVHAAFFGDPRFSPSLIQREMVEAGRLGRKAGRGFFDYGPGAAPPTAASFAETAAPGSVRVDGDWTALTPLLDAWTEAGIAIQRAGLEGPAVLSCDDCVLALTDGRSATERSAVEDRRGLVLFDLAPDYGKAARVALAAAEQSSPSALACAAGLFQAAGKSVSVLADVPGLIGLRTLAMLASEAADAVLAGVSDAPGVDRAMMLGANYPLGPLAWADAFGPARVLGALDNLARTYGEDRYRASSLLRRIAARDGRFHEGRS